MTETARKFAVLLVMMLLSSVIEAQNVASVLSLTVLYNTPDLP